MKLLTALFLTFALACLGGGAHGQTQSPSLELKRVLLSLGGVGYFEFEASVTGNAELSLPVRLDQVDDVLKSVVVFDDKGAVGQITLPGRDPLSQTFKDLPFNQAALATYDKLLAALSGAQVTVSGPRQLSGRILSVVAETARLPDRGGEIVKHRVTLASPDGMQQFVLEDAESLRFTDAALQRQVDAALAAIARHRQQDQRVLTVTAQGKEKRLLRVGYVVSAPLWKTSYRLTVPDAGAKGPGFLQGWAVLENLSGHDWTKVELTLASGNPVTFRQQLYNAYFVQRPEVPVDVLARVAPQADRGSVLAGGAAMAAPGAAPAGRTIMPGSSRDFIVSAPKVAEAATGESQEASTQVLFSAPEPVSVKSGETLMLPIVNRRVPVERVTLYQPSVNPTNPLAALRLTNDTGAGLPPGIMTLYEQGKSGAAHVGDARLALTPAGESRLVSFAVDYKVVIDRDSKRLSAGIVAKIARGVLTLSHRDTQTDIYRIKSSAAEPHLLIIEHPRLAGFDLIKPKPDEVEIAGSVYRIRVPSLKAGTTAYEVSAQITRSETIELGAQSRQSLIAHAQRGGISEPAKKALERLAGMMEEVDRLDTQVRHLIGEADAIVKDQERVRQNLASVPPTSDLAKRYLEQLKTHEDQLDQLRRAEADTRKKAAAARDAFADAIAKLEV